MTTFAFSPVFSTGMPNTLPNFVSGPYYPGMPTGGGLPTVSTAGFNTGNLGALGAAGCDLFTDPTMKSLCLAGVNAITGGTGSEPGTTNADAGTGNSAQSAGGTGCPTGYTKVGSTCVDVSNALPGGKPLTTPASGTAVAKGDQFTSGWVVAPETVTMYRRKCRKGFVLGFDGNCYHKSMIPNKLRRWPKAPRPPVTRSDVKAIRKAANARNRVEKLGKDVGLHVYKSARKSHGK